jgi:hypothetical protein
MNKKTGPRYVTRLVLHLYLMRRLSTWIRHLETLVYTRRYWTWVSSWNP